MDSKAHRPSSTYGRSWPTCDRIILVATGARPGPLEFPGHEHLIDSTDFLNLKEVPSRILFVGGGIISFEFAHVATRAGGAATIIDRGERPLNSFDPDLVELLTIAPGFSAQDGLPLEDPDECTVGGRGRQMRRPGPAPSPSKLFRLGIRGFRA